MKDGTPEALTQWITLAPVGAQTLGITNMKEPLKKGDIVLCIAARDERNLTLNKKYKVLKDEEPGIFADRPFVIVESDCGPVCYHASRFQKV